jgi:hypothetical protein
VIPIGAHIVEAKGEVPVLDDAVGVEEPGIRGHGVRALADVRPVHGFPGKNVELRRAIVGELDVDLLRLHVRAGRGKEETENAANRGDDPESHRDTW